MYACCYAQNLNISCVDKSYGEGGGKSLASVDHEVQAHDGNACDEIPLGVGGPGKGKRKQVGCGSYAKLGLVGSAYVHMKAFL